MPAPAAVIELVERFAAHRESYRSGGYKEAQLREEFVNPLFAALGWDVANASGYAEAYKDVVHEDAIRIGGATKAPDYCFRVGGARKFFVEVKKPSVAIRDEPAPAFQLRRYAWSAKLPLSILTDFEEFGVYDCRTRPRKTDKAAVGRTMYFTCEDLSARWEDLAAIFSREAVLKGSFDKYAEGGRGKKGTAEVDAAFLEEIESWREELAKNLALRNPRLSVRDLNFAVARTIDRIVFLRIAEDRGIESYGALLALLNGGRVYQRLLELFNHADERYNSGLFHFREEPGQRTPPDELTTALKIDDETLRRIVRRLYYPESPYEFAVLPADILGQVYEQFLGKVIRLTAGHQARVDDKPEVKKAGGVYYTPTYIVDYIVRNTLGKLLEGKTPRQVRGAGAGLKPAPTKSGTAPLRILDPACGSGSFLIGAYQHLLDWYRDRYVEEGPAKRRKELYQGPGGEWRLATAERKRILLTHIYGVDIDQQAVEVTKLSLLLKVLEGESGESLRKQLLIFHERALPDLGANVKCGNSLIGPDYFAGQLLPDEEEMRRINAFDWRAEFPEVFHHQDTKGTKNDGGFDCVIGNPPYVLVQTMDAAPVFEHLKKKYSTAQYKIDTYQVFMEQAIDLTRPYGCVGYITPNTYLRNKFAKELRACILERCTVDALRIFCYPVFQGASVDTSIILLTKRSKAAPGHVVQVACSEGRKSDLEWKPIPQSRWAEHAELHFFLPEEAGAASLAPKMEAASVSLGEFATAYFGIQTFDRTKYVKECRPSDTYKPVVDGGNISRYRLEGGKECVCFRADAIKSGGNPAVYEQARIGVRQIGETPVASLLPKGLYTLNTIYNVFFTKQTPYDIRFVLAMMSSSSVRWYWRKTFFDQKRTFPKVKKAALLAIPIPKLDFSKPADQAAHDRIVSLVDRMLDLHKRLAAAKSPDEKTRLDREIKATDAEIDRLVYELYGLTVEEIAIVEGAGNG